MKRLIINADDFGYTEGVVRGIIELHEAGLISSTSCMTNMPAWPQATAYLRQHPELGAGVHLVFNAGRPVLPAEQVPALLGQDGLGGGQDDGGDEHDGCAHGSSRTMVGGQAE